VREPVDEVVADLRRHGAVPHVIGPVDSKRALITALGAALDFPEWVGTNWDALHDALGDLSWQPPGAHALVWVGSAVLERASPRDHELALRILSDAAEASGDSAHPLTVLLAPEPPTT